MMPFSDIQISQGSVATCLKRGGKFKHEFVANLLPSPLVKRKIENRIIFGEVIMAKSLVSCFFDSRCSVSEYVVVSARSLHRRLSSGKRSPGRPPSSRAALSSQSNSSTLQHVSISRQDQRSQPPVTFPV